MAKITDRKMAKTKMVARRKVRAEGNLPLFGIASDWKAPSLSDLPDWSRARAVGLDTEGWDEHLVDLGCGARRDGVYIAGISFMLEGDRPYYLPLRHPEGNVDNPDNALRYVKDNVTRFRGQLLGANLPHDLDTLKEKEGIEFDYSLIDIWDVCLVEPLIDELQFSYSLFNIGKRNGVEAKSEELLKKVIQDYGYDVSTGRYKKYIAKVPAKAVGPYGEGDVRCLFPIRDSQSKNIDKQNLHEVRKLSAKVLPLLLRMRQRGVAIDFDQLDRVEQYALEEEKQAVAEILRLTGVNIGFRCMAASAIAPALEAIGVQVPLTEETEKPSITTALLETIDHPVAKLIRWTREMSKLRNTFADSIRRYQVKGRIHTTFRQIVGSGTDSGEGEEDGTEGAAFGRLSSADPNLQQQPARGKYAKKWRSIYLPDGDGHWLSADYSAIEPRITCHFAELLQLPGAKSLGDQYRNNPRIDPHGAMAAIAYGTVYSDDDRKHAKQIVLGTTYGMGGAKLCKQHLHLPTRWLVECKAKYGSSVKHYFDTQEEAVAFRLSQVGKWSIREVAGVEGQAVQDKFHEGAPFLKELVKRVTQKAEQTGFLRLLGGRVVHFPMKDDGSYDWTYKACNRLIQGTAGMHLQHALLAVEEAMPGFLQLTVHDEVCGTIYDMRHADIIRQVMIDVIKFLVPLRVDLEVGKHWGENRLLCLERGCVEFAGADGKDKLACQKHSIHKAS